MLGLLAAVLVPSEPLVERARPDIAVGGPERRRARAALRERIEGVMQQAASDPETLAIGPDVQVVDRDVERLVSATGGLIAI